MTTLYKFAPAAYAPIISGNKLCPLIIRHYAVTREGNETKTITLPQPWINYMRRTNSLKGYKHIISKTWGPSKGINKNGMLIFNMELYPGPGNLVAIREVITGVDGKQWGVFDGLPIDRIPDMSITHKTNPELIHLVWTSTRQGGVSKPNNQPRVPVIGTDRYVPMRWLVKA